MNYVRSIATLSILLGSASAQADNSVSRYRVTQLQPPASVAEGCVTGYSAGASVEKINDFGVVNAVFYCHTAVDVSAGILTLKSVALVTAPGFEGFELPTFNPGFSYSYTVNNRGELFGYESGTPEGGGLFAARWTLFGGHERIFFDPTCESINFQAAVDGNGKYIVGWALRGDDRLPPPVDLLCIRQRWVIRDAAGVESYGPVDGTPAAINQRDVAVGIAARGAVRYHVPSGQLAVLHAADSARSAEATDINDLGEISGRITTNSQPDFFNQCDRGVAVRWDRDGRERSLPHLPGAVSSHAFAVGYDGETIGDSGAGNYCPFTDNASERAVLWKNGRVHDLNSLIPRNAGVTLTYAYGVNRRGQITAGGYVNAEPLTLCPSSTFDPVTMTSIITTVPCHQQRMFVLTPVGR